MRYCTILDDTYLDRLVAMHASMVTHCQDFELAALAMTDKARDVLAALALPGVRVLQLSDVATPELMATQSGRTLAEFVWTCKSALINWLLPQGDRLLYLDCDGFFFSTPTPLWDELGDADLGITPHRFPPRLKSYLVNGECNGGVIYARNTDNARRCIGEWAANCVDWCYLRYGEKWLADQKYLNEWPAKYSAHHIRHVGVNCAPWNQECYSWGHGSDGRIYANNYPLIWYHFHQGLTPHYPISGFVLKHVYGKYSAALDAARERLAQCGYS